MHSRFYDTDLTNAAWARVAPATRPGGRPRTTNLRAVLNAIFRPPSRRPLRMLSKRLPPRRRSKNTLHYVLQSIDVGAVARLIRCTSDPPLDRSGPDAYVDGEQSWSLPRRSCTGSVATRFKFGLT